MNEWLNSINTILKHKRIIKKDLQEQQFERYDLNQNDQNAYDGDLYERENKQSSNVTVFWFQEEKIFNHYEVYVSMVNSTSAFLQILKNGDVVHHAHLMPSA